MMSGFFVVAGLEVLGCGVMMLRGKFVMVGCEPMMLSSLMSSCYIDLLEQTKEKEKNRRGITHPRVWPQWRRSTDGE